MRREDVSAWLDRYVAAWKSGDRDDIESLFSEDARYRYHAYDEPIVGARAIADSWLEDPDAPDSFDASYDYYAVDGDAAVAVGTSSYLGEAARVYDNVFVLRFDAGGRCCDFTEWYTKRP